jgi:hypothetical protein
MKIWIQLVKHFQGGSLTTFKHVEESSIDTDGKQQEMMEDWGENTDGGHAYGYKVYLHILPEGETPPVEWLEKELSRARRILNDIKTEKVVTKKERLQKQRGLIEFYKQLVEKNVKSVKETGDIVTTAVPGT